ncbi:hypothetical protein JZ751_006060 [Albula glossodonta]|uniref:Uncharacterized protein n=1 Tax=Albula glossodonta TaxID=121402 RepID=A0A8T2P183_9TELE|nr:hypothetical protein JZ751_006060 [Albula glossodonta]
MGPGFFQRRVFLAWNGQSGFGKRSAGSLRRGCECIVLEPSEMIVVSPHPRHPSR